jgi:hypothetical protein
MNVKELFLFVLILQTYEVSSIRTQMNICTGDGKVLPSRQVSDDDSCRRINSTVMKIRLFKPKNILEYRNSHRSGSLQFIGSLLPERQ